MTDFVRRGRKTGRSIWLAERLTVVAILIGLLSTISYALGAHMVVRYVNPPLGAWWKNHEFWVMEGSASALGWLVALRLGARLIDDAVVRGRVAGSMIAGGLLLLAWITPACATLARLGCGARGEPLRSRIEGWAGYGSGWLLDKVLMAGVYFLKTAAFALMLGLALSGLALAVFIAAHRDDPLAVNSAAGT